MLIDSAEERWLPVLRYEGLYEVSNCGRVRRPLQCISRGNRAIPGDVLQAGFDRDGYRRVVLCRNGRTANLKVARLVAIAFVPNPYRKPEVNHLDFIRDNDHYLNLEWVTRLENVRHQRINTC